MDRTEIATQLKQFFEREFPNPGVALTDSTDLLRYWLVDSLGIVTTTLFLETSFGVDVTRADIRMENYQTIDRLTDFITRKLHD